MVRPPAQFFSSSALATTGPDKHLVRTDIPERGEEHGSEQKQLAL